jgi:hypothetical protein
LVFQPHSRGGFFRAWRVAGRSAGRTLHFLVPDGPIDAAGPQAAVWNPLIKCGQQSLEVFAVGIGLSFIGFCGHPGHHSTLADDTRREWDSLH